MKSPAMLLLVTIGGLWLQVPRVVTASCGLCLFSGEACPYVYDGFSGIYCGMFKDSMGFSTECCCPDTMGCAATATTCQCTAPIPAPAPTTSSTPTTASTPAPTEKSSSVSGITTVAWAVASTLAACVTRYAFNYYCQRKQRGGDEMQVGAAKTNATATAKPTNAKVQNSAKVDVAADAVVQLAQIILNNIKDKDDDDDDS